MKSSHILGTLFILLAPSLIFSQELVLVNSSGREHIMLGEKVSFTLYIDKVNIDSFYYSEEYKTINSDFFGRSKAKFTSNFSVQSKKVGEMTVGPYFLNINGKDLSSNKFILQVSEEPTIENMIYVEAPEIANVNFETEIKIKSNYCSLSYLRLKKDSLFELESTGYSSSIGITDGVKHETSIATYNILFKDTGQFVINQETFIKLPSHNFIVPDTIKIVRE
jgi:hypothetical protein